MPTQSKLDKELEDGQCIHNVNSNKILFKDKTNLHIFHFRYQLITRNETVLLYF